MNKMSPLITPAVYELTLDDFGYYRSKVAGVHLFGRAYPTIQKSDAAESLYKHVFKDLNGRIPMFIDRNCELFKQLFGEEFTNNNNKSPKKEKEEMSEKEKELHDLCKQSGFKLKEILHGSADKTYIKYSLDDGTQLLNWCEHELSNKESAIILALERLKGHIKNLKEKEEKKMEIKDKEKELNQFCKENNLPTPYSKQLASADEPYHAFYCELTGGLKIRGGVAKDKNVAAGLLLDELKKYMSYLTPVEELFKYCTDNGLKEPIKVTIQNNKDGKLSYRYFLLHGWNYPDDLTDFETEDEAAKYFLQKLKSKKEEKEPHPSKEEELFKYAKEHSLPTLDILTDEVGTYCQCEFPSGKIRRIIGEVKKDREEAAGSLLKRLKEYVEKKGEFALSYVQGDSYYQDELYKFCRENGIQEPTYGKYKFINWWGFMFSCYDGDKMIEGAPSKIKEEAAKSLLLKLKELVGGGDKVDREDLNLRILAQILELNENLKKICNTPSSDGQLLNSLSLSEMKQLNEHLAGVLGAYKKIHQQQEKQNKRDELEQLEGRIKKLKIDLDLEKDTN